MSWIGHARRLCASARRARQAGALRLSGAARRSARRRARASQSADHRRIEMPCPPTGPRSKRWPAAALDRRCSPTIRTGLRASALDVAGHPFRLVEDASDARGGRRVRGAGQGAGPRRQARGAVRRRASSTSPKAAPPSTPPSAARARRGVVATARALHARMRALIDAIEAGRSGRVRHILHIGIGGSALGPRSAGRCARPRSGPLRRRDRLQRRWRRAGGGVRALRSRRRRCS